MSVCKSKFPNAQVPDDLIYMALSDKVSFEAIYKKYGLREIEVKRIMRSTIKRSSYINWRKRVQRRPHLHKKKYSSGALNTFLDDF
tara:strand:- start:1009 stop:1266 length:258 start_codon:yes stop_codon:yes gene_type:complete